MGSCTPDWPGDNGGGEYAPPRCPALLGAACAPDVACKCRDRNAAWLASFRPAPAEPPEPPAVPDTLRREALKIVACMLPDNATPAQHAAGAYLIGLFLHTGRA